jgi:hypothetical protein
LSLFDGSVSINLYEDYLHEGEEHKVLVARRNLDLFSYVNKQFLYEILEATGSNPKGPEIKYDLFYLKKLDRALPEEDEELEGGLEQMIKREVYSGDKYIKLTMAIHLDKYLDKEDLIYYFLSLKKRKAYLEERIKVVKFKAAGYKQKLNLMILPFNQIMTFDEKSININAKNYDQGSSNRKCSIF